MMAIRHFLQIQTRSTGIKKREHASHFVYDSGCMTCHSNLKNIIQAGKSFLPHRDYFVLGNPNKNHVLIAMSMLVTKIQDYKWINLKQLKNKKTIKPSKEERCLKSR